MRVWEQKLAIRRQSCEFRLHNKRMAHADWIEKRNKTGDFGFRRPLIGHNLMRLQNDIRRELEEIRFIKLLGLLGPLVGDDVAVQTEPNSQESVSLFHILERIVEDWEEAADAGQNSNFKMEAFGVSTGIRLAMEIIKNPREYMTTPEQEQYDAAIKEADEREKRAEKFREPVQPPQSFKATTAVKSQTLKPKNVSKAPATQKSFKIVNGKAVFE